jgi:TolB-like protein
MARADGVSVAVMPFEVIGESSRGWMGKAIQEGLASNLQQYGMQVAGNSAGADYVVSGSVQIVDEQMRITGKITSGDGAKVLGHFHSDGMVPDLFSMEDSLSSKVDRIVHPNPRAVGAVPAIVPVAPVLASGPRYFDGNLAASLAVPKQFESEYNRYNYNYNQFPYCWWGCYPYWGYSCYYSYWPWYHIGYSLPQATLSTW